MIRSFLPIGQGGFAVEQFEKGKYNVVFDCGTKTGIRKKNCSNVIKDEIRRTFEPRDRIQKVFITHFHEDHINGLPFLLEHCCVDEIYMPYLTWSEKVITLILLQEYMNDATGPLLQDLVTGRPLYHNGIETRTAYVLPPQAENYAENESHNARHIPSGEEIERDEKDFNHDQWCFIPYAFQGDQRATKFEDFLNKNGISSDLQHIILHSDFWNESDQFKKVRKAYEEISSKDINRTTMTVFSGSKSKDLNQHYYADLCYWPSNGCPHLYYSSGCLYTGDYCAKNKREWEALRLAYDAVWNRIGVFTVPHHGSSNSYNNELSQQRAAFIINSGYNNSYRHPNHVVLRHLIDNECRFFWVNEHVGSEAIFWIDC